MAAILKLSVILLFLSFPSVLWRPVRLNSTVNCFNYQPFTPVGVFYLPVCWFHRLKFARAQPCGHYATRFTFAAVKHSRRGTTSLHLPGKDIYFDLTIHMDVEPNPGPSAVPTTTSIRSSEFSFTDLHLNTATRHYSRDKILSLRPFAYSPKCLSSEVIDLLQNLKILKYRGKRAGSYPQNSSTCRNITNHLLSTIPTIITYGRDKSATKSRNISIGNLIHLRPPPVHSLHCPKVKLGIWNARSIKNKTARLCEIIFTNNLDLLAVVESWSTKDAFYSPVADVLASLKHFSALEIPRQHKKGGGVLLLYRNSFEVSLISNASFESYEHLDLSINYGKSNTRLLIVYRPPPSKDNGFTSSMFFDEFSKHLELLALDANRPLAIVGDFNYHMDDSFDQAAKRFADLIDSVNFRQHVNSPTHRNGHTLDLIITRATENLVQDVNVHPEFYSDHRVITCSLNHPKPPRSDVTVTQRSILDREKFSCDIIDSFSHGSGCTDDVNALVSIYNNTLLEIYDKHAPLKMMTVKHRRFAKWYNDQLRHEKREKRRLERRYRKSGLTVDMENFHEQSQKYNNLLEKTKTDYYRIKIQNSDKNQLFRLINNMFKLKSSALPSHQSSQQLAEDFNDFFINKISDIRAGLNTTEAASVEDRELSCCFTDFELPSHAYIVEVFGSLTPKTCDLDPIPTSVLKQHVLELAPIIARIVCASLASGEFPSSLKTSIVRPKLKKPDLDSEIYQNFRPLANISFISKVIEKSVAIQTYSYLNNNALFPSLQSAYRLHHSTETALLRVTNDILKALDSRNDVILILLDLSAAFDTLDHDILLSRLHLYFGFKGTALNWFTSYLRGRTQRVNIAGSSSSPRNLHYGVPQGSILGPLLFTLYIAPLQDVIATFNLQCMFYADDTQLYIAVKPSTPELAIESLSTCIKAVFDWNTCNKLQTNRGKTEVLRLTSRFVKNPSLGPQFMVAGVPVNITSKTRNLGVIMDANFTLSSHINDLCKKAFFFINSIGRIRKYLPPDTLKRLVNALVISHLDYCNSLLYGLPSYELSKLQRVQNSAARLIVGARRSDHMTPILRDLHWLPIPARLEFKILLLTYKCLHNQGPSYLRELLKFPNPSRILRSSMQSLLLKSYRPNTLYYGERSFAFAAPKLWNSIPEHIKSASSLTTFKTALKTYLFRRHFRDE